MTRHLIVQRSIRGRIESGEWPIGQVMLGDFALAAEYGVSRTTIRQALGVLVQEGQIVRMKGRGTIVLGKQLTAEARFQQLAEAVAPGVFDLPTLIERATQARAAVEAHDAV